MTDASQSAAADDHVLDAEGHFHAVDEPIDLSVYRWEDWLTFVFFWLLALDIFYQFFTRYVLADSAAWTEEIARYLLIVVCFVGAAMGVRKNTHIHVEFIYHWLPAPAGRVLSTFVDVVRVAVSRIRDVARLHARPEDAEPQDDGHRLADELHLWLCRFRVRDDDVPFGAGRRAPLAPGLECARAPR